MVGSMAPSGSAANRYKYEKELTASSLFACVVASSAGLLFGYDLGITGGVLEMEEFKKTFFPVQYEQQHGTHKFVQQSPYCKYNSAILQLFPSVLYIAGFFASLVASYVAKIQGRKFCLILSGSCYLIGVILTTAVPARQNALAMLIVGRAMLGCGVGFANASVTVYASEVSPPKYRGTLTLLFQWCTTFGILVAQLINYGTATYEAEGWRISLAIAAVPAILILVGGFTMCETPSFLISKDRFDEGRKVLQKIRGSEDVEEELNDITVQTRQTKLIKHPLWAFIGNPCYRPYLTISVIISICHQLSGSNAINFYAPQIFATMGHGRQSSLLKAVILGSVKCGASFVSLFLVDSLGRRRLLIWGGSVMVSTAIICGVIMGYYFHNNHGKLPKNASDGMLSLICIFLAAYEVSWGPLAWLIPAEIQPAEIRTAGMSIATSTSMLFSFLVGQTFLSMMCAWHFWVFIFFAGIVSFGIFFTIFLLPECKGLHIEEVHEVFSRHWFWSRCPPPPRDLALPEVGLVESKNGIIALKKVSN